MPSITPSLWFDNNLEEAAQFYTSVFPNSSIEQLERYTEAGPGTPGDVVSGTFVLDGNRFIGINGGPQFPFSEAVSFLVSCKDQDEVDYYWDRLVDGGEESQCGWLKDRFGLSWQIVPDRLFELVNDPDPARAAAATKAMLGMHKIVINPATWCRARSSSTAIGSSASTAARSFRSPKRFRSWSAARTRTRSTTTGIGSSTVARNPNAVGSRTVSD